MFQSFTCISIGLSLHNSSYQNVVSWCFPLLWQNPNTCVQCWSTLQAPLTLTAIKPSSCLIWEWEYLQGTMWKLEYNFTLVKSVCQDKNSILKGGEALHNKCKIHFLFKICDTFIFSFSILSQRVRTKSYYVWKKYFFFLLHWVWLFFLPATQTHPVSADPRPAWDVPRDK